jgi:putative sterol carrier protein
VPYFQDEQDLYACLGQLFVGLAADVELATELKTANAIVQFQCANPTAQITLKLIEAEDAQVDLGPTELDPDVVLTMEADVAHRFWLGKVNPTMALALGQIKTRGPIAKILTLVPLVKPVFPRYKAQLEAAGRSDLLAV